MTKRKTWLATSAIILGTVIMLVSLVSCGFNFKDLDTAKKETNEYEISDAFDNIYVNSDTADVTFIPTESNSVKVVCKNEKKNMKHYVSVNNGTLEIKINDERKWYDHISVFSFSEAEILVYLPEHEYDELKIESDTSDVEIPSDFKFKSIDVSLSTGDTECRASATEFIKISASTGEIEVENVTTGALEITASTGDVDIDGANANSISVKTSTGDIDVSNLTVNGAFSTNVSTGEVEICDVSCKSFASTGSTGKLSITRLVAAEAVDIKRDTGDVTLDNCDAGEIVITTDTGDVKASLLTEKVFITRTDTGKIRVPETTTGGKCKITTDTGDITVTVSNG